MRRKSHDQRAYLFDMLDNAQMVASYIGGMDFNEFWDDHTRRDAVALRLAMIGEAAVAIDAKTERSLPTIPFGDIRGLRNRIVHDYGAIDFRAVWKIATENVPPLIEVLVQHLGGQLPN